MSAVSSAPPLARTGSRSLAGESRHMNPYLAGFGLGLVLLAAFLIMGRGLGATAASARSSPG